MGCIKGLVGGRWGVRRVFFIVPVAVGAEGGTVVDALGDNRIIIAFLPMPCLWLK